MTESKTTEASIGDFIAAVDSGSPFRCEASGIAT